jgi:hypothetical protein
MRNWILAQRPLKVVKIRMTPSKFKCQTAQILDRGGLRRRKRRENVFWHS